MSVSLWSIFVSFCSSSSKFICIASSWAQRKASVPAPTGQPFYLSRPQFLTLEAFLADGLIKIFLTVHGTASLAPSKELESGHLDSLASAFQAPYPLTSQTLAPSLCLTSPIIYFTAIFRLSLVVSPTFSICSLK